eukprot:scaffold47200_cov63-Phaeocystis_antarctica.AAC.3
MVNVGIGVCDSTCRPMSASAVPFAISFIDTTPWALSHALAITCSVCRSWNSTPPSLCRPALNRATSACEKWPGPVMVPCLEGARVQVATCELGSVKPAGFGRVRAPRSAPWGLIIASLVRVHAFCTYVQLISGTSGWVPVELRQAVLHAKVVATGTTNLKTVRLTVTEPVNGHHILVHVLKSEVAPLDTHDLTTREAHRTPPSILHPLLNAARLAIQIGSAVESVSNDCIASTEDVSGSHPPLQERVLTSQGP